jgi:hypothetical protein
MARVREALQPKNRDIRPPIGSVVNETDLALHYTDDDQ